MGGSGSKMKQEDEYLRMLKRRRQRATEIAEKESHMKGKAYYQLNIQQQQQQQKRQTTELPGPDSQEEQQLPRKITKQNSEGRQMLNTFADSKVMHTDDGQKHKSDKEKKIPSNTSKSPKNTLNNSAGNTKMFNNTNDGSQKPQIQKSRSNNDLTNMGEAAYSDQRSPSTNIDKAADFGKIVTIKRVPDANQGEGESQKTKDKDKKASQTQREALQDRNLEWVSALLDDLEATDDNIYKDLLKARIDKMLGSFTINMDPSNYRRLYLDKTLRETLNLPKEQNQANLNPAVNMSQSTQSPYSVRGSVNIDKFGGNAGAGAVQQPGIQKQNSLTQKQIQNMATPATSMGLQEILTNPALQSQQSAGGHRTVNLAPSKPLNFRGLAQEELLPGSVPSSLPDNSDKNRLLLQQPQLQSIVAPTDRRQSHSISSQSGKQFGKQQSSQSASMLTNEEKILRQFMDHDIVGLSIFSASTYSKYSMKINTLRQHLSTMDDHPIVKLKDYFREILEVYVKKQSKNIEENMSFFKIDSTSADLALQHKKLFDKIVKEIKGFVQLMHDSVVRFYMLDIKVGMRYKQNEHLTNMLTSLVLKNPIYSEVHAVIRLTQRPQLKQIVQTINSIRSKYGKNLEEQLKIDPIKIGHSIYQMKQQKEQAQKAKANLEINATAEAMKGDLSTIMEQSETNEMAFEPTDVQQPQDPIETCNDQTAEALFRKMLRRFQNVRNVSSPILKLITIYRQTNDVMDAVNGAQTTGPHEADFLIVIIFYLLVSLSSQEAQFLGARFIEECCYIDSFIHEDQVELIEEYTNIAHMKVVLETLQKGLRTSEKAFISQSEGSSGSRSSQSGSGSALGNALEAEDQEEEAHWPEYDEDNSGMTTFDYGQSTVCDESSLFISDLTTSKLNESALNTRTGKNSAQFNSLSISPYETPNNMESFDNQPEDEESSNTSQGLSILQKLQQEGLFNFKNVPEKAKPKQKSRPKPQQQYISPDAAYRNFHQKTSFVYVVSPDSKSSSKQTATSKYSESSSSSLGSENLLASKSTIGSTLQSSSTLQSNNKSSFGNSMTMSPKQVSSTANKQANLAVIQEEHLMVEEGCENELENNRLTLQKIRQKTLTWQEGHMDEENKTVTSPKVITQSELEDTNALDVDLKLSIRQEDQFGHIEQHE